MWSMNEIYSWLQIAVSILLIISILLQKSEAGIGGAFGAGNDGSSTYRTRRGAEKFLFRATIFLSIVLLASILIPIIQ